MRRLSDLPEPEARAALRACCGASRWVERMLTQRPFKNTDEVFASAERIWWDLGREDWLEAFAAHPKIGERETEAQTHSDTDAQTHRRTDAQARAWSQQEQAGAASAEESVKQALAEANRAYEARFGHIYIVCATGRSAEEMLALCRARLAHDEEAELRVAAAEQAKITNLRLTKLLEIGT